MSYAPRESVFEIIDRIQRIERPRLLLRAARLGLQDYDRQRDLRRVLRLPHAPAPGPRVLHLLLEMEEHCEARRTRHPSEIGDSWRAAQHVELLICLIAESRLLAQAVPMRLPCPAAFD